MSPKLIGSLVIACAGVALAIYTLMPESAQSTPPAADNKANLQQAQAARVDPRTAEALERTRKQDESLTQALAVKLLPGAAPSPLPEYVDGVYIDPRGRPLFMCVDSNLPDDALARTIVDCSEGRSNIVQGGKIERVDSRGRFWAMVKLKPQAYDPASKKWISPPDELIQHPALWTSTIFEDSNKDIWTVYVGKAEAKSYRLDGNGTWHVEKMYDIDRPSPNTVLNRSPTVVEVANGNLTVTAKFESGLSPEEAKFEDERTIALSHDAQGWHRIDMGMTEGGAAILFPLAGGDVGASFSDGVIARYITEPEFRVIAAGLDDPEPERRDQTEVALRALGTRVIGKFVQAAIESTDYSPEQQLRLKRVDKFIDDPHRYYHGPDNSETTIRFDDRYAFGQAKLLTRTAEGATVFIVTDVQDYKANKAYDEAIVIFRPDAPIVVAELSKGVDARAVREKCMTEMAYMNARFVDKKMWLRGAYCLDGAGQFLEMSDVPEDYEAMVGPDASGRIFGRCGKRWFASTAPKFAPVAPQIASATLAIEFSSVTDADAIAALKKAVATSSNGMNFRDFIRAAAAKAPLITSSTEFGKPKWQSAKLNRHGVGIDVLRFRTPKDRPAEMVWGFSYPWHSVAEWYVLKMDGEMSRGFTGFSEGARVRDYVGVEGDPRDEFIDQGLAASSLEPDAEYVIWMRFKDEFKDKPVDMHVAMVFVFDGPDHPRGRGGVAIDGTPVDWTTSDALGIDYAK